MRGTAVEAAWLSTHIVMYPWLLLEQRNREAEMRHNLEGLAPVQRGLIIGDVEAAGTPIILVHGVVDNHTIFSLLRRSLMRRGFGRTISLNYSPLTDDIRRVAKRLSRLIESVCRETGYERVHVIGHSMGGLIGRYYVQRLGGDARVHTLVTLGTPHSGSAPASLVPHNVARQLRRDSDIVAELNEPAPGCRTRFVAVWSDLDQMIIPNAAPASSTRTSMPATSSCAVSAICRCRSTDGSCTKSARRWLIWTPTVQRSRRGHLHRIGIGERPVARPPSARGGSAHVQ